MMTHCRASHRCLGKMQRGISGIDCVKHCSWKEAVWESVWERLSIARTEKGMSWRVHSLNPFLFPPDPFQQQRTGSPSVAWANEVKNQQDWLHDWLKFQVRSNFGMISPWAAGEKRTMSSPCAYHEQSMCLLRWFSWTPFQSQRTEHPSVSWEISEWCQLDWFCDWVQLKAQHNLGVIQSFSMPSPLPLPLFKPLHEPPVFYTQSLYIHSGMCHHRLHPWYERWSSC